MISFEVFLIGLSIVSVLTGLVTEAVKHILAALKVNYQANILSGIVALILSAAIGVMYIILANVGFTAQSIISLIVMTFLGWLGAMVGYDKVVQAIDQLKNIKKG